MIAALLLAASAPVWFACGAVERPGIAERGGDGVWRGVAIDLCRQTARGRPAPPAEIRFHPYRSTADLRDATRDAVAVLSPAELAIASPGASPPTGPPVAISRQVLLIHAGSPLRQPAQLPGQRVCFIVASAAEAALNAWARPLRAAIQRVGFQEPGEMRDAFDAGYCAAMAVDAADVPGGAAGTRTLGLALAEVPVFVVSRK